MKNSSKKPNRTPKKSFGTSSKTKQHAPAVKPKPKVHKPDKSKAPVHRVASFDSISASPAMGGGSSRLPDLPDIAMPGWIGDLVLAICMCSEAHPVSVLVDLLLRLATHIYKPYVMYDGMKHYCRTNAAIICNSARTWKVTVSAELDRIFEGIPDKALCVHGNILSGEPLIKPVSDNNHSTDAWDRQESITSFDKCLLFNEQEVRSALAYAKRHGSITQTISELFNHGSVEKTYRSRTISTYAAHVNILARTSCIDFATLKKDVNQADEFSSYFLWLLVGRLKGVPKPERLPDDKVAEFRQNIMQCIYSAKDRDQMYMSEKAETMWNNIYPDLTRDIPGVAGMVASRSEIHLIRFALIYAIAAGHKTILRADLKAAYALIRYSQESASIIFNGSQKVDSLQNKILLALRAADNKELCRTEIHEVLGKKVDKVDIDGVLQQMVELKLIEMERKESTAGRKKNMVRLVAK